MSRSTNTSTTRPALAELIEFAARTCDTIPVEEFDDSDWVNGQCELIWLAQRQDWHETSGDEMFDREVMTTWIRNAIRRQITANLENPGEAEPVDTDQGVVIPELLEIALKVAEDKA